MFDHVGIAVSGLAASERFSRTVLSVLAIEPSLAPAYGYMCKFLRARLDCATGEVSQLLPHVRNARLFEHQEKTVIHIGNGRGSPRA